ncbi:hypothetical protein B566_EDAN006436 [Ephemera danica]|nr:hypothetical protein B566_EDAN006436 [Ephemera danica]
MQLFKPSPMSDEEVSLNDDDIAEEVEIESEDEDVENGDGDGEDGSSNQSTDGSEAEEEFVPEREDAKIIFQEHTGSVFCCDIDKTGKMVVTGGEDDLAYVWNITNGNVEFTCTGHKDSVTSASFNKDGTLVATGDMSGEIRIWKVSSKDLLWSDSIHELTWMEWHPASNIIFVGSAEGHVTFWRVPSGDCKVLPSPGFSTQSGKVLPDGTRAVIGYEDGSVRIFDLRSCKCLHTVAGQGSSHGISTIGCHRDNNLILAGTLSGDARLITTKNGKLVSDLLCTDPYPSCVESAVFCPVETHSDLAACVTTNGDVSIWEISKQEVRDGIMIGEGVTKLGWSPTETWLVIGCLNGEILLFNALDTRNEHKLLGHRANILDFCLTGDGSKLVSVSDDHTARVFEMPNIELSSTEGTEAGEAH